MELKEKIKAMINTYGVSGDEFDVAKVAAELIRPYVDHVEVDKFGNVAGYRWCKIPGAKKLMLDSHIDQVGFMVNEITDEGFLRFVNMGVDQRMLIGSELTILTENGPIPGIVCCPAESDGIKSLPIDKMVVDIGMSGEAARKAVRLGDYMAFSGDAIDLQGDALCGKAMDDRACLACIIHALQLLKDKPLAVDIVVTGSTKEESGKNGATTRTYLDRPDYGIAVDVCHAKTADSTNEDDVFESGCGPVISIGAQSIPKFAMRLIETGRAKKIPHQIKAEANHSGTNASVIQATCDGSIVAVVSLPVKYMHSPVEMLRMSDVEATGKLIAEFVLAFDGNL